MNVKPKCPECRFAMRKTRGLKKNKDGKSTTISKRNWICDRMGLHETGNVVKVRR